MLTARQQSGRRAEELAAEFLRAHGFEILHRNYLRRLGELDLEDASVGLAVAHPHRGAAYDASRWIIEELKRRVPIWKRERYVDGTREWVDPLGRPAVGAHP